METSQFPVNSPEVARLKQRLASIRQQIIESEAEFEELQQAQKSLMEREAWLRTAMDAAMVGPWEWNFSTGSCTWSPVCTRLLGLPSEQQESTYGQCLERIFPDDRQRLRAALESALTERSVFSVQFRVLNEAGGFRWIEAQGKPFFDASGSAVRMAGVIQDISTRKEIAEQITKMDRTQPELEALGSNLSHSFMDDGQLSTSQKENQLHALTACLMAAQDEERKRIARDLHDNIGQRLAILAIDVESALKKKDVPEESIAKLPRLRASLHAVIQELADLSHNLHPSILDQVGLAPALQELCQAQSERQQAEVQFCSSDLTMPIPDEVAKVVYRITQEALHNVMKHATNSHTLVRLSELPTGLQLSIEDDGPGFDPKALESSSARLGIISMQERARQVSGIFSIQSRRGTGTQVQMFVPFRATSIGQ